MKHKKSPSRRARHLRGYKSGNKIITYSDTKSNAPDNTMIVVFIVNKKNAYTAVFPGRKKTETRPGNERRRK